MTVAEFRGNRICSLRQYFDRLSVLEQLGLLSEEAAPGPCPPAETRAGAAAGPLLDHLTAVDRVGERCGHCQDG